MCLFWFIMKFGTYYFCEECESCVLRAESLGRKVREAGVIFGGGRGSVILAAESLA